MHVVIFEVTPKPEHRQDYLDLAAQLRPHLEKIDGFISVERFGSLTTDGKLLSLSFWRDAEAIRQWRTQPQHASAQLLGRQTFFADFRIRVGSIERDYGMLA